MAAINFKRDHRISPFQRMILRDFCSEIGGDIAELANKLGVKVFADDLLPYEHGYLEYDPLCESTSGFKVVINAHDSRERQRFTVAHELAHFLLHKENAKKRKAHRTEGNVYDPFVYLEPSDRREEVEANRFAATLLMPPNLFKPAFERLDRDPKTVARLFGVSSAAVEIHAANLGL